jgi:hypothetical protein
VIPPEVRDACRVVLDWLLQGAGPAALLLGRRAAARERVRLCVMSVLEHFLYDWGSDAGS